MTGITTFSFLGGILSVKDATGALGLGMLSFSTLLEDCLGGDGYGLLKGKSIIFGLRFMLLSEITTGLIYDLTLVLLIKAD
jgi:hypothetical protein